MAGNLIYQDTAAIAAGATVSILAGEPVERPPFDAFVNIAINGSAAGLRSGVYVGGVAEFDDLAINALNRFPVLPDDIFVVNGACPAGQLNRIRITNPTAGALTHFTYAAATIQPRNI